jgi:hypothetical protein
LNAHYEHIKDLLESAHSRSITDRVIAYVEADSQKFNALMDLFFSDDWLLNQRAAWPIPIIVREYPELIEPYKEKLVLNLENPSHNAVVRNTIRLFEDIEIPEDLHGRFYEIGLKLLINIKEPVANKVFTMTVMYKIAEPYPELLNELKLIIETQLPYEKPGFKSRGKKTLALIDKRLNSFS